MATKLKSKVSLNLGYLNRASNNPAQELCLISSWLNIYIITMVLEINMDIAKGYEQIVNE